ncbi:hypothetical protein GGI43DRAFT_336449 [Trichoderma evansii]
MAKELIRPAPQTRADAGQIDQSAAAGLPAGRADGFLRLLQSGDGRAGRSCAFGASLAVILYWPERWRGEFGGKVFCCRVWGFIFLFPLVFLVPISSSLCEESEAVSAIANLSVIACACSYVHIRYL